VCTRVQEGHNQTDRFYIDIADVSLQQMKKRYQTMRNVTFRAEFIALDCYSVSFFFDAAGQSIALIQHCF
jgi:hypothetical protein